MSAKRIPQGRLIRYLVISARDHERAMALRGKHGLHTIDVVRKALGRGLDVLEADEGIVTDANERARSWLASRLVDGPREAGTVLREAAAEGLSRYRLDLAARALGVLRRPVVPTDPENGAALRWRWSLPIAQPQQQTAARVAAEE